MRIDPTPSNVNTSGPTNPYHIARAYGVRPGGQVGQAAGVQAAPAVADQATARQPTAAQALVAAVVPGGVDFQASSGAAASARGTTAQPSSGSPIQMYRHPADKNAAATAVQVGRRLDVSG